MVERGPGIGGFPPKGRKLGFAHSEARVYTRRHCSRVDIYTAQAFLRSHRDVTQLGMSSREPAVRWPITPPWKRPSRPHERISRVRRKPVHVNYTLFLSTAGDAVNRAAALRRARELSETE